ncbi:MAG: hypothetical protein LBO67_03715 [Spirochaetaceae bacterium]|nr:hypothetical protein [Spirochaetaceae bacterium]
MQETISPEKQGRVFSLLNCLMSLAMPLGLLIAGPAAEAWSIVFLYGSRRNQFCGNCRLYADDTEKHRKGVAGGVYAAVPHHPKPGIPAPGTGVELPETGVELLKMGVELPKTGMEPPKMGVAFSNLSMIQSTQNIRHERKRKSTAQTRHQ